jgi:hypothetical protein
VTDINEAHVSNALLPTDVACGRFTLDNEVQKINACAPTDVACGRFTLDNAVHCSNALAPITVAFNRLMDANDVHPLNAFSPTDVTCGRLTPDDNNGQFMNALAPIEVIYGPPTIDVIVDPSPPGLNTVPNPVTGSPSSMSGITTSFGPL